jgi:hypothetical protein
LPQAKGPFAAGVRSHRRWLNKFPACSRANLAAARTSLAKVADGSLALDRVVALRGQLVIVPEDYPLVAFLDKHGEPRPRKRESWHWDLALCEGERMEIRFPGKGTPTNFRGSASLMNLLARHPPSVVVSGELVRTGGVPPHYLRIENARICRL